MFAVGQSVLGQAPKGCRKGILQMVAPLQSVTKKPRLLLIDSNPTDLENSSTELKKMEYRLTAVDCVKNAVNALKERRFALILLDMTQLQKEHYSFLKQLKAHKTLKTKPVIVFLNKTDDKIKKQLIKSGVSDFVEKPTSPQELQTKITQQLTTTSKPITPEPSVEPTDISKPKNETSKLNSKEMLLPELSKKIKSNQLQLPPQPKLLHKVITMLNDEETSLTEIADIIAKDAGVSSRILMAANSAQFAGSQESKNTHDAIMRIGLKRTLSYVMVIQNSELFTADKPPYKQLREDLWKHSLITAVCGKTIAEAINYSQPDNIFAYGLLHDVGKLTLVPIIQSISTKEIDESPELVEEVLDKLHAELGGQLFNRWSFPEEFIKISKLHHEPPRKEMTPKYILLVSLANIIANLMDESNFGEKQVEEILNTPHAKQLKISHQHLANITESVSSELELMGTII